ncbi:MAG: helicase [Alphaproteobacteria bacterium]|nr:helicase [Alphaproteobacteria bacterium]
MLGHGSGIIGLPLRLLAREVYNRIVARTGPEAVALITGEEKIKPKHPRYWVSTVEAMPRDLNVDFVAIDEIQLAANLDRGHVFTDRLLNRRGRVETLLIGADTMQGLITQLLPGVNIITRPRLSHLGFAGERKLSRLPRRSAIVAFSAEEVYAIAELIRRQRGGAAVVMGALSPRTRNAQVDLYQNGDVDYIIATDAIGMGLNLDVDHVAFASDRKFDGWHHRRLLPAEFGQIAGRAGRHVKDGTFGSSGRCAPFEPELVEALEAHRFDPVTLLQWRNTDLDFTSIDRLQASLDKLPEEPGLTRAPLATDILVLDIASHDPEVRKTATNRGDIQRLWEVCQIPDYRKVSPSAHADLALTLYRYVVRAGLIPDDWFARHLAALDRTDGDIDALSARIAQVRTYNYIANRPDWLRDPEHWQGATRQVEDSLSDALHEKLALRFVDRRTSLLMRRLRENAMLEAEITSNGDVLVEGQHVGQLQGFRFTPDPAAAGEAARTLNAVAQKALAIEIEARANRIHQAVDTAFVLAHDGLIRWLGEPVAKITSGEHVLRPMIRILADDQLTGAALELVQTRIDLWLNQQIKKLLGPLFDLEAGEGLEGLARGMAFQIAEALGVLERGKVAQDLKSLDQNARGSLRKLGIRFGAYHLYLPALMKPAPRALAAQLWALKNGGLEEVKGLDEVPHLAASGRTSFPANTEIDRRFYLAAGFRVSGERAVRVDILERLADLIRLAINYRPGVTPGEAPAGAADRDGFVVTVAMTSLAGCSGEQFASILKSLGYSMEQRKGPAITVPLIAAATTAPLTSTSTDTAEDLNTGDASAADKSAEDTSSDSAATETPAQTEEQSAPAAAQTDSGQDAQSEPVQTDSTPAETEAQASQETSNQETAPSEAAPSEAPSAQETLIEEALIEVWHPNRRPQHQAQRHHNRPKGNRPANTRSQHNAPRDGAAPAEGQSPTAGDGAAAGDATQRPHRHERDKGRRFEPRSGQNQGRRQEQTSGERPAGDRPHKSRFEGKFNKRPDRGPQHERNFASTEKPKGRDKQPDPDSPFAKLAALKAALETKGKS